MIMPLGVFIDGAPIERATPAARAAETGTKKGKVRETCAWKPTAAMVCVELSFRYGLYISEVTISNSRVFALVAQQWTRLRRRLGPMRSQLAVVGTISGDQCSP